MVLLWPGFSSPVREQLFYRKSSFDHKKKKPDKKPFSDAFWIGRCFEKAKTPFDFPWSHLNNGAETELFTQKRFFVIFDFYFCWCNTIKNIRWVIYNYLKLSICIWCYVDYFFFGSSKMIEGSSWAVQILTKIV